MTRVLVIDDEPQIRRALRAGLERNGYAVTVAASGEEGLDEAALHPPDVVVLDLAMPGTDGFAVCRQLREWSHVPIIVLSVREDERDKIDALNLGADDYLTKPFSLDELIARMRAVLRRAGAGDEPGTPTFTAGDLQVDFARRIVCLAGVAIHLTPTEYELLRTMVLNEGRVLTHRQLLAKVWGAEYVDDTRTLRVHIAHLRDKIEADPTSPRYIHTEPRVGYRFRYRP
ncbi:MAG: response regulator transcription factor [Armatimonadetes bacterium]|nr:response regulator transcription factor [Armatimonadota bacterium]